LRFPCTLTQYCVAVLEVGCYVSCPFEDVSIPSSRASQQDIA
jgi:hypothetical protein